MMSVCRINRNSVRDRERQHLIGLSAKEPADSSKHTPITACKPCEIILTLWADSEAICQSGLQSPYRIPISGKWQQANQGDAARHSVP
jgi:hypothetical protein